MVDLGNEAAESTGSDIYLLAVIRATSSVNIKACQDLTDGFVYSKNDL